MILFPARNVPHGYEALATPDDDPRAPNCRAVAVDQAGKVRGVELTIIGRPQDPYELTYVTLFDELASGNKHTAKWTVFNVDGRPTGEKVILAWAWEGEQSAPRDGREFAGSEEHVISEGYDANRKAGPYVMYPADDDREPIGDLVCGVGLPWNRHVRFYMEWTERSGSTDPTEPEEPTEPGKPGGWSDRIEVVHSGTIKIGIVTL